MFDFFFSMMGGIWLIYLHEMVLSRSHWFITSKI